VCGVCLCGGPVSLLEKGKNMSQTQKKKKEKKKKKKQGSSGGKSRG